MKTKNYNLIIGIFPFISVLLVNCTVVTEIPKDLQVDYPNETKIGLNIELRLSEQLKNAKWEEKSGPDTYITPLGSPIYDQIIVLANKVFSHVKIGNSQVNSIGGNVDAMLTPQIALITGVTPALPMIHESSITVAVEWKLEDKDNNLIWVETVKGEAKDDEGPGYAGKARRKRLVRKVVTDLFQNSFDSITSSTEIKKFEAEKNN